MQRDNLLELFRYCDFEDYISDDNYEDKILAHIPYNFKYIYSSGVSKLCIIPIGADFVIKIPFNSSWNDLDEVYEKFFCATDSFDHQWDYCFSELLVYNLSKSENVNKTFCKTRLLGQINNYPIYIQERATPLKCIPEKVKIDSNEIITETETPSVQYCKSHGFKCFSTVWIKDAMDFYGERRLNKILAFIKNNHIHDLHNGNIGYIGDRPVLLDFSGYNE